MSVAPPGLGRRWTVQDLGELPADTLRYELVDGCLVVTPGPTQLHQVLAASVRDLLQASAPEGWRCLSEFPIAFAVDTLRQTDVAVFRWPLRHPQPDPRSPVGPADVGMLVEVVSPHSRRTDRFAKPGEYADAGITLYWRLETEPDLVLHTFILQGASYVSSGQIVGLGVAPTPWGPLEVDLTRLGF